MDALSHQTGPTQADMNPTLQLALRTVTALTVAYHTLWACAPALHMPPPVPLAKGEVIFGGTKTAGASNLNHKTDSFSHHRQRPRGRSALVHPVCRRWPRPLAGAKGALAPDMGCVSGRAGVEWATGAHRCTP